MTRQRRILVVDDNPAIHQDFRKLLAGQAHDELEAAEAALFGDAPSPTPRPRYQVESAFQGQEGLARVERALAQGEPYALAFVDIRMPPGWNGVETIERVFAVDSEIQVVVCSACSDYSWEDFARRFPGSDRLLILKKPFDTAEVCQLAAALTEKWHLAKRAHLKRAQLEAMVEEQTSELRRTADALLESRERFALAAAGARDGIWDWDLVRDQVYYSPRWRAMFGLPEDGAEEAPALWLDRVDPAHRGDLERALEAHFSGETPRIEHEYRALHADGQPRWFLCRGVAIRDESGRTVRAAGSQTDITDRRLAEEQLRRLALHDALTGLPNRALLHERLERCIARAKREKGFAYAVLYLDLDRFKLVNDSLGHAAGDALLRQVAERIVRATRGVDTLSRQVGDPLSRLGGDEFALLLEGLSDGTDALRVAERVVAVVSAPFELEGQTVRSGCSVGIVLGDARHQVPQDLLREADLALYHAKERGRGRFEVYDELVHAQTLQRWQLEEEMRAALGTGAFKVHYQPVVTLDGERVTSVEALVRWEHPRLGRISPAEFIPLAEETGLIEPLGREVLAIACRDLRRWRSEHPALADLRLAINVSPRQMTRPGLAQRFAEIARAAGVQPSWLDMEITESVLMDGDHERLAEVARMRELGMRVHLDDFGTGYCSLSYLRRVRVDALKIDRSFVQAMESDPMTEPIVRAIIDLAHTLGIQVVAEGVERESQRRCMQALRCDLAQGYLFLRPTAAEDLPAQLMLDRRLAASS